MVGPVALAQGQGGGVVVGLEQGLQVDWGSVRAFRALGYSLDRGILLVEPRSLDVCLLLRVRLVRKELAAEVRNCADSLILKGSYVTARFFIISLCEFLLDFRWFRLGLKAEKGLVSRRKEGLTMIWGMFVKNRAESTLFGGQWSPIYFQGYLMGSYLWDASS